PSPRRYVELRVDLLTDQPEAAPTLVWLQLTHTPPLALRALGEIFPSEVRPGVVQEFSYFVRTDSASAGFDGLSLEASAPPTFVDAFLSSQRVDVERSETERGFRITMPRRVRGGELLELRFTSAVFLHGTRFEAFLEDSRLPDDRQRVDEGDATPDVASNTNIVGLPVGDDLLANVVFMARVISPNGDGVNDELRIDVDVVNVLLPRQLTLEIFDLAGRQVYRGRQLVEAGRQQLRWEARDTGGRTVPPGVYVVKLNISGDARSESVRRTVAVVY
ncbi:MAG: gliding motility-associated C-terminal domain-containing protein, partial [Candidatus Latescibacterota bacterium]